MFFTREIRQNDRGAGLVEYALVVLLIALGGLSAVSVMGESTADSFDEAAVALDDSTTSTQPELTPDEKWEQAKQDYEDAIAEAKAEKAAEIQAAKDVYNQAKKDNKSLPKAERKEANNQAKTKFNESRARAKDEYKTSVQAAKDTRSAAKAEWKATR